MLTFVPGRHVLVLTFVPGRHILVLTFVQGTQLLLQTMNGNFQKNEFLMVKMEFFEISL